MTQYAPVGICTYTRINHLRQTIEALLNNDLAGETAVFVFSDAPRPGDENKVAEVRDYLGTIRGFGEFHVIARQQNGRVPNCRGGVVHLLGEYGRMIFMEDDIVTAPGFLKFMNQALDKYENNDRVFSVCGYCPPIPINAGYGYDAYFWRRFSAWGYGIWKNRYDCIHNVSPGQYNRLVSSWKLRRSFIKGAGADALPILKREAYGEINANDMKAMYAQFLSDQYTIYPTGSLVRNTGMDGTGVHCGVTDKYEVTLNEKTTFLLPENLVFEEDLIKQCQKFYEIDYTQIVLSNIRSLINQKLLNRKT